MLGRCGSTLLSQILEKSSEKSAIISEPDFTQHVLLREEELPVSAEDALGAGIRVMCKPRR